MITSTTIEEELSKYGSCASRVRGNSMRPLLLHERDAVFLKKSAEVKKYDVVLYKNNDTRYVLHRIIKIKGDTLIIRGDNTYAKEYVRREDILAVLDSYTRRGKHKSVNDSSYKLYSRVWCLIYPLRRCGVAIRRALSRVYHSLFKKK